MWSVYVFLTLPSSLPFCRGTLSHTCSLEALPSPCPSHSLDSILLIPEPLQFIEHLLCTRLCIKLARVPRLQITEKDSKLGKREFTGRWLGDWHNRLNVWRRIPGMAGTKADPETNNVCPATQYSNTRQEYNMVGPLWTIVWQLLTQLNTATLHPNNSTSGYLPKRNKSVCTEKY